MQGGGGLRGRHTNEAQMQFTAAAPPLPPPRPPPSFLRHSAARRRPARTHACRGAARHREKVGEGNFYRKYDVKACNVRFFLPGGHISARVQLRLRSLSAFRYLYALFRQTLSLLFRLFIQPLLSRFLDGFATGRPSSAGDCASAAHQRCTRLAALPLPHSPHGHSGGGLESSLDALDSIAGSWSSHKTPLAYRQPRRTTWGGLPLPPSYSTPMGASTMGASSDFGLRV